MCDDSDSRRPGLLIFGSSVSGLKSVRKEHLMHSESGERIPQRLKPSSFFEVYGTAQAVPFQNRAFLSKL